MKKAIISTLAAATLAALSGQAQASVELRMSWWGGNDRHQSTLKAIELFQQHNPDIKVKAEYTGWDGHLSRLTTQIAGNTEPDVMQTNWNWLPIFSKDGQGFYDLGQQAETLQLSNFSQTNLNMAYAAGKLNGVPVSMSSRVFYYNADSWQKAGLDYPESWEELLAAGPVFKEKLGDKHFPLILEHQDAFALLRSYMIQKHNTDIVDADTGGFNYSDEQWQEFFGFYQQLVAQHVIPSSRYYASFGKANLFEMRPWITGEFGGLYMWDSTITKYSDNLQPPMKLELGNYPMLDGATDAGLFYKPSLMFSIGRNSKHPEEAARLIDFLLNQPEGVEALGLSRGVPLSRSAHQALSQSGVLQDTDLTVLGMKQSDALPKELVASPHFDNPQLVTLFHEAIQSLDYGRGSVEDVAANFKRNGSRLLARVSR
ncbi:ABC transporter substrate-binding protein [Zobellella denitrificans]